MQKPTVNRQEDTTTDGVHIIFGVKTPRAVNIMLRKRMIKAISSIWNDLPITNSWEAVLDEEIAKGGAPWPHTSTCTLCKEGRWYKAFLPVFRISKTLARAVVDGEGRSSHPNESDFSERRASPRAETPSR